MQQKILKYYKEHGRHDLPWRQTTDPYKILVSEIMLQQTQVDRVIPKFNTFIATFPTAQDLADASTHKLLELWQGLGYNNRALRLRECAKYIAEHGFPQTPEELIKLPGIGKYTSRSVLIFAYNKNVATVDTNIRRILIAELGLSEEITEKELYFHAEQLLPKGKSRDWHNALMDYGATLLTARKTGIRPTSRQGKFVGSDRYYRGKMLKELLLGPVEVSVFAKEFSLEKKRFAAILAKMEKDNIVVRDKDVLYLAE